MFIRSLDNCAKLPEYRSEGASGMDLFSAKEKEIYSFQRCLISTGVAVAIPKGYEGQVRSRSGLSIKQGLVVLNSPGTIDSDYRGEVGVILYNTSQTKVTIERGQSIAQLVISPIVQEKIEVVEDLDTTERGEGGFGSTGM